jgi:hypothetical protein
MSPEPPKATGKSNFPEVPWSDFAENTALNVVIFVCPVPLLAPSRGNLIVLTSGHHSAQNPLPTAKSTASDASMAD